MEANELMIGDWVSYNGIANKVAPADFCQKKWISELEPIPLTTEILEKNGFVLKEEEKGAYGVDIAPYYTRNDVPFEIFCDGEPFAIRFKDPVNIKYVHELQHAMRLCGIEKEIVL
jgi:hypothetical protein